MEIKLTAVFRKFPQGYAVFVENCLAPTLKVWR